MPPHDKPKPPDQSASVSAPPASAGVPKAPEVAVPPSPPEPPAVLTRDGMLTLLMCPECGGDLTPYDGSNVHKIGTATCPEHGRVML